MNAIAVTASKAKTLLISYLKAKLVPMLRGSPGIGKSAIVRWIAKQFNLLVIDMRLAQCDPTDLLGFPNIVNGRSCYVPMATFPIEGDPLPINPETGKPYSGWLLFLDEFTSASRMVQAASYKLILDRMVGIYKLHPNVAIICAGNLETDNAIVEPMSTALQSRLAHLELVLSPVEWCNWANSEKFDHRITDFIEFQPGNLYTFKPDHVDHTYACPRTWEFTNDVMKHVPPEHDDSLSAYAGVISEGVTRSFLGFCEIYRTLPKISKIASDPSNVTVPDEPSVLFALSGSIADNATTANIDPLMKFVRRLPEEFQVVTLRSTVRRHEKLFEHQAVQDWLNDSAVALF